MLLVVTGGVLLWTLFATLRPLPGRDLTVATGPAGSAYARAAERYRQILARDGVRLHLVPTNGAVDNLRLLKDRRSGIGAGFVQAGTIAETDTQDLVSLGTLFYEEAWLFCRCPDPVYCGDGGYDDVSCRFHDPNSCAVHRAASPSESICSSVCPAQWDSSTSWRGSAPTGNCLRRYPSAFR